MRGIGGERRGGGEPELIDSLHISLIDVIGLIDPIDFHFEDCWKQVLAALATFVHFASSQHSIGPHLWVPVSFF